jgi:hypothetical protein
LRPNFITFENENFYRNNYEFDRFVSSQSESQEDEQQMSLSHRSTSVSSRSSISSRRSESEEELTVSEGESSENDANTYNYRDALCSESCTTVQEFIISFFAIINKNNINDSTANNLLLLFKHSLPEKENKCPKNIKSVRKYFDTDNNIQLYNACSKCKVTTPINKLNISRCNNCEKETAQFAIFDIIPQLQQILTKDRLKDIKCSIKTTRQKLKTNSDLISTAMDGSIYNNYLIENKSFKHIISLNLNSDGAPLAKKFSLWPIFASIVELDHETREKYDNIIILGLWLGKSKPLYHEYCAKVVEKLEPLLQRAIFIKSNFIIKFK